MKTYGPEYEAWLASLKVGDTWTAIVPSRWGLPQIGKYTITGETKKQWKAGACSFWKANGREVGGDGDLYPPAAEAALSDVRAQIRLKNLRVKLSRVNWQDVSLEALTQIDAILNHSKETTA